MSTYYITVGAPGSGKSTHCKSLGIETVCPDAIVDETYCERTLAYDKARELIKKVLQEGRDVILDATNVFHRNRKITFGKRYADKTVCLWFDTPYQICVDRHRGATNTGERNSHRYTGHTEPYEEVIKRYCDELAQNPPSLEEGFDEIIRITPD